jgi:hypothetical protein
MSVLSPQAYPTLSSQPASSLPLGPSKPTTSNPTRKTQQSKLTTNPTTSNPTIVIPPHPIPQQQRNYIKSHSIQAKTYYKDYAHRDHHPLGLGLKLQQNNYVSYLPFTFHELTPTPKATRHITADSDWMIPSPVQLLLTPAISLGLGGSGRCRLNFEHPSIGMFSAMLPSRR